MKRKLLHLVLFFAVTATPAMAQQQADAEELKRIEEYGINGGTVTPESRTHEKMKLDSTVAEFGPDSFQVNIYEYDANGYCVSQEYFMRTGNTKLFASKTFFSRNENADITLQRTISTNPQLGEVTVDSTVSIYEGENLMITERHSFVMGSLLLTSVDSFTYNGKDQLSETISYQLNASNELIPNLKSEYFYNDGQTDRIDIFRYLPDEDFFLKYVRLRFKYNDDDRLYSTITSIWRNAWLQVNKWELIFDETGKVQEREYRIMNQNNEWRKFSRFYYNIDDDMRGDWFYTLENVLEEQKGLISMEEQEFNPDSLEYYTTNETFYYYSSIDIQNSATELPVKNAPRIIQNGSFVRIKAETPFNRAEVRILSIDGKILMERTLYEGQPLDLSSFKQSIILLEAVTDNQQTAVQKIYIP